MILLPNCIGKKTLNANCSSYFLHKVEFLCQNDVSQRMWSRVLNIKSINLYVHNSILWGFPVTTKRRVFTTDFPWNKLVRKILRNVFLTKKDNTSNSTHLSALQTTLQWVVKKYDGDFCMAKRLVWDSVWDMMSQEFRFKRETEVLKFGFLRVLEEYYMFLEWWWKTILLKQQPAIFLCYCGRSDCSNILSIMQNYPFGWEQSFTI